jgi:hypothetical protein
MMNKNYITLEELEKKEAELVAKYNEYYNKGWNSFAENTLNNLKSVRYVMSLIDGKSR